MIDLSHYPPAPVTWVSNAIDTVCSGSGLCNNWRDSLSSSWTQGDDAWFSPAFQMHQPVRSYFPDLLTYSQYLVQQQQQQHNDVSIQIGSSQLQIFRDYHSWHHLQQWMLATPSTSLADVTSPSSWIILLSLIVVLRVVKGWLLPLFSQWGRSMGRRTHGAQWEQENAIRIVKFGEYVFRLLFHGGISMTGILIFWSAPWWQTNISSLTNDVEPTYSLWLEYPHQPIAVSMIWYYLVQCAYNLDAMASLLELSMRLSWVDGDNRKRRLPRLAWSESVRGDFREMFVHHVVTNLLVMGSSFFRLTRVGSMCFLVHDISDVPVDMSKLANFLKWHQMTSICFATMVLVWCVTRLGVLLFTIYRSVLWESWMVTDSGVIAPIYYVHYQPFFVVLIGLLISLHFCWFTMFLRMGYRLVFKGEAHDLSEHKQGETHPTTGSSSSTTATATATNGMSNGKKHQ